MGKFNQFYLRFILYWEDSYRKPIYETDYEKLSQLRKYQLQMQTNRNAKTDSTTCIRRKSKNQQYCKQGNTTPGKEPS